MTYIQVDELPKVRERHKNDVIVFCPGSFDITHAGHVLFLEDCKRLGDILVVSVGCDENLKNGKGNDRPILNEHIRIKMVSSLKPVDYCFLDFPVRNFTQKSDFLKQFDTILKLLKPNKYVINSDAFDIPFRRESMKKHPYTDLVLLERKCPPEFDNISTTKIIEKIRNTK